jgi:hypothetical protein
MLAAAVRRIILFGGGARTRTSTFLAFEGILMAKSRKFLTVGALGVGALALIGAGAGATFNSHTTTSQTITAGTANVVLTANGTSCLTIQDNCHSITLSAVTAVGSTFLTTNPTIWMHNIGNIPVDYANLQLSEAHNPDAASVALRNEMNVCIQSTDPMEGPNQWHGVEVNGPLMTGVNLGNKMDVQNLHTTLQAGDMAPFSVDFYAGKDSACGAVTSAGSITAAAWGDPVVDATTGKPAGGGDTTFYKTPASLTDDAQGGLVIPTLTFAVTG